ncbi:MAG TPA: GIDE domain-containing protein [Xanthobacteraceae bacterium]|nr:GIDE domain-containing protein [Xanthobacteraceae bacterium]
MNLVLGICAAVAALGGLGFMWWRSRVGREIALMASLETSGAGSVAALAPGTAVEVKGTLRVRVPLKAEYSGQPAAYYKCEIEREETYYERDSNGRDERKTRTTTVYSNMTYGQCLVEDGSGRVGIDFDGAEVEAVQTVNEPTAPPGGGGGVIGGVLSALSNSNATYRRKESILAPDIAIYVLGEVHQGGLIGKPASGSTNKTFVISHKSEEERTKSLTSKTRWLLVIAIALLALAVVLAGFGVKVGK